MLMQLEKTHWRMYILDRLDISVFSGTGVYIPFMKFCVILELL